MSEYSKDEKVKKNARMESVTDRSSEACNQIRNIRKRLGLDEDDNQQKAEYGVRNGTFGEEQELRDQYEALEKLSSSQVSHVSMFDKENIIMMDECIDDKKFQNDLSKNSTPTNHKKSHSQNPHNESAESELRPRPFSDVRNIIACTTKPELGFSTARDQAHSAE